VRAHLAAGGIGALFGVGLALSGMTNPSTVLGFLDVAGRWNPSLMFVMAGAVGVHALLAPLVLRRSRPLFATAFARPKSQRIDGDLIAGAAIFGVGWGLAGYCPGPALVSLPSHSASVLAFACAMTVGMLLYRVARPAETHSATATLTPDARRIE
jgi:uncharacterized membrane protein YedE/YeeE